MATVNETTLFQDYPDDLTNYLNGMACSLVELLVILLFARDISITYRNYKLGIRSKFFYNLLLMGNSVLSFLMNFFWYWRYLGQNVNDKDTPFQYFVEEISTTILSYIYYSVVLEFKGDGIISKETTILDTKVILLVYAFHFCANISDYINNQEIFWIPLISLSFQAFSMLVAIWNLHQMNKSFVRLLAETKYIKTEVKLIGVQQDVRTVLWLTISQLTMILVNMTCTLIFFGMTNNNISKANPPSPLFSGDADLWNSFVVYLREAVILGVETIRPLCVIATYHLLNQWDIEQVFPTKWINEITRNQSIDYLNNMSTSCVAIPQEGSQQVGQSSNVISKLEEIKQ